MRRRQKILRKTYMISASTFCMERMLDCQKISDYLKQNGWRPVTQIRQANLIIISTCSFGQEEDRSSLEYINFYLRRKNLGVRVIIAGCLSAINPELLLCFKDICILSPTTVSDIEKIIPPIIGFSDLSDPNKILAEEVMHNIFLKKTLRLSSILNSVKKDFKPNFKHIKKAMIFIKTSISYIPVMRANVNPFLSCNRNGFYYLRISKGCLGSCSYCAKKFSTGNLHSKSFQEIVDEFKLGINTGEKHFYLLAEDIGCYGVDRQTNIVDLLRAIFKAGDSYNFQIILSNFNAYWFIKYYDELEPLLVKNSHKIAYIQVPIQSGSSYILQLMNRRYTIEDVKERLLALRKKVPNINLVTDIIVGFPGETQKDFELTKKFLSMIRFQHIDIFGYEKRPNTKAATFSGSINLKVIAKRVLELARMQNCYCNSKNVIGKIVNIVKENFQHR